ncbi:unnamed protein product [Paramecium octaurelia]|uniref:Uncharacterized protein n=1 Tax=Paramecium octaurelia TaxID=43137 RepID=A0A8S1U7G9_PAROT|nr:unnamed protein product [Paramecium octaurelia]
MNNEINIRQLLYYKKIIPHTQSQRSITLMSHQFSQGRLSVHSQEDLRLSTNVTNSSILPQINLRYSSVHSQESIKSHHTAPTPFTQIQCFINKSQKTISELRLQTQQIKQEISIILEQHEQQIQELQSQLISGIQIKYKQLKDDNINTIMESYRLKKEVVRLIKSKSQLLEDVDVLNKRITELESILQSFKLDLK